MNAFIKTLFGDARNIAGVVLIVAVAMGMIGAGHSGWAVFAMPAVALGVVSAVAAL